MSNIAFHVKLKAQPGKRAELLDALKALVAAAADEDGTLQYVMSTPDDDPDTVLAFELYRDEEAFNLHSSSPAMMDAIGKLGDLIGDAPEMIKATPVQGKGF